MGVLEAHTLDWINARVVRWRIGGRQPQPQAEVVRAYLETLPGDPFESIGAADMTPVRERRSERGELWRETGGDWVATRYPATNGATDAALVFLHGWLATPGHVLLMRSAAQRLLAAGIEVWIPRLPAHIERTPPGSVSGARCLSADLAATGRALQLAVEETCGLAAWLRANGRRRVGLWGISLGGWVAALAATCRADWDAVALWTPVVDPLDTLRFSPLMEAIRGSIARAGIDELLWAEIFQRFAPVRRRRLVSSDRLLVIAGQYDNVVSHQAISRLRAAWGVEPLWAPHGHISILWSRRIKQACRRFLIGKLGAGREAGPATRC